MSLLHFIKLILKNLKLLIAVPVVLAVSVYYFTRHEKKVYSSDTVVYTGIASGYSLNGNNRADFFATNNAFDNLMSIINSRETKQEVAIRLLAEHLMLKKHDPDQLSWDAYQGLQTLIPDSVRKRLERSTPEAMAAAITNYLHSSEDNLVYDLLNSTNPFYSVNALQSISPMRLNSSDLIKISYSTQDAAICKRTLELLIETFMRKHRVLREGQTESVIAYFEQETQKSFNDLDAAERDFLEFNKNNDIINYYEQTKAVAGEKEHLYALDHSLEMDRTASGRALDKINTNLEGRKIAFSNNSRLISQRDELSKVYNNIAVYETMGEKNADAKPAVDSLQRQAAALEKNLKNTLDQYYVQTTTPDGIPSKDVLDEWLRTTIAYEQGKARLTVMDKRKKEFQEEYRKMAPLGAMLKKIERKISVAEQAYLEMLHGLNLARLTQQNNALTSKLTVVDPPYLPVRANASIRIILIAVSFIAGFIIIMAILLTKFLLNKTMQEPARAVKNLGIPVLSIYPIKQQSKYLVEKANLRLLQQVLANVNIAQRPLTIGFVSMQEQEGKTELIQVLKKGLFDMQCLAQHVEWNGSSDAARLSAENINLVELPALEHFVYTPASLPSLDYVFVVCRANRIWTRVDKNLLQNFSKTTQTQPYALLNGVDLDFAEAYIGEAPKKRGFVRSLFKRLAKLEFGNRTAINRQRKKTNHFNA